MKEVAAITGGTSGIGKACVERFIKDGYEVRSYCQRIRKIIMR
jgi:NAD(P)-dependent dehydrogenase (short-subunit alcohol dehydrogenase family)